MRHLPWLTFLLIGTLIFVFALYNAIYIPALDPADPNEGWAWLTRDPQIIDYIKFNFRIEGVWQIPLALLVMIVAAGPLRQGQRWAWQMLWIIPAHFLFSAC